MTDENTLAKSLGIPLAELRAVAETGNAAYRYERRLIGKKIRLLRPPRERLMKIQRAIKTRLLDSMPLPPYVHGWRKRRSPKTYAKVHIAQAAVINADIQDFFPTVPAGRVYGFWLRAGYQEKAAKLLTALTTCDNQLPQGAPTSQSIGNHVLLPLHRRLRLLARIHGLRYGAYGDEIAISGRKRTRRLKGLALRIIEQEGFRANPKKTEVMLRNARQKLTGIVVNRKPSIGRPQYRELRAIVHNCLVRGPTGQNRTDHPNFKMYLRGKIAHLEQVIPRLGNRLLAEFERIIW